MLATLSFSPSHAQDSRLDSFDLLRYRDAQGNIHRVENADHWQLRRAEIVRGMERVMGPLPDDSRRVDLAIEVLEEVPTDHYVRQLITYQSEPESRAIAYLCIPNEVLESKKPAPAALCLHPTDNRMGHKVVLGLGGREGRQYATELAERGYVTIAPAYPHLANYWPNLSKLGYVSGTMKAIWDNTRAIDLLEEMELADTSQGVVAIGHSLGGHNAIYTAVFDERIACVATSCGFDSFTDYYDGAIGNWYFGRGWCQIRYMPRMSDYRGRLADIPFDFPELIGALAPRPLFVNAPLHDSNFRWRSVDRCVASGKAIYELFDAADAIVIEHPDTDHNFPADLRRQAYEMFDQHFMR